MKKLFAIIAFFALGTSMFAGMVQELIRVYPVEGVSHK